MGKSTISMAIWVTWLGNPSGKLIANQPEGPVAKNGPNSLLVNVDILIPKRLKG